MISGPLNNEGNVPGNQRLTTLETNETHPAVVRCLVTCLNQRGTYGPAMALIITSQEQFEAVYYYSLITWTTDGVYSRISLGNISYCEAQNNYTIEFEYLLYSIHHGHNWIVQDCNWDGWYPH